MYTRNLKCAVDMSIIDDPEYQVIALIPNSSKSWRPCVGTGSL